MVSHDRHMLALTADRLVLVDDGTAREFDGSLEDYTTLVLAKGAGGRSDSKSNRKEERRAAAEAREKAIELRKKVSMCESEVTRLTTQRSAIDRAMFDPSSASGELATLPMSALSRKRGAVSAELEAVEARWLEASEALENSAASSPSIR